jgi:hypothetical protein
MSTEARVKSISPRGVPSRAVPAAKRPLNERDDQIIAFSIDQILQGEAYHRILTAYKAPLKAQHVRAEEHGDVVVIHCACDETTIVADKLSSAACPTPGCGLLYVILLRRVIISWNGLRMRRLLR